MGTDIHVHIIQRDLDGKWKSIKLYTKDKNKKFKKVNNYPFRNCELFDILSGNEADNFPYTPICMTNLPIDIYNEIKKAKKPEGCCYNFYEVNLADLKLYLNNHPKVRDYDYEASDDEDFNRNGWKDNPVKFFIERIENILDLADSYWDYAPYSSIRIIYWFDC